MNPQRAALVLLLACAGCAGIPAQHGMARWSPASDQVLIKSSFPANILYAAKLAIAVQGMAAFHCEDGVQFALRNIEPAIANAGLNGPEEIWTTDMCGMRKWLVTPQGKAYLVPSQ